MTVRDLLIALHAADLNAQVVIGSLAVREGGAPVVQPAVKCQTVRSRVTHDRAAVECFAIFTDDGVELPKPVHPVAPLPTDPPELQTLAPAVEELIPVGAGAAGGIEIDLNFLSDPSGGDPRTQFSPGP